MSHSNVLLLHFLGFADGTIDMWSDTLTHITSASVRSSVYCGCILDMNGDGTVGREFPLEEIAVSIPVTSILI